MNFYDFSEYSLFLKKKSSSSSLSRTNHSIASASVQINTYMEEDLIPFDQLKNPLEYWQAYRDCELKEVAQKYLIACATSIPSERVGSSAGNTCTQKKIFFKSRACK